MATKRWTWHKQAKVNDTIFIFRSLNKKIKKYKLSSDFGKNMINISMPRPRHQPFMFPWQLPSVMFFSEPGICCPVTSAVLCLEEKEHYLVFVLSLTSVNLALLLTRKKKQSIMRRECVRKSLIRFFCWVSRFFFC